MSRRRTLRTAGLVALAAVVGGLGSYVMLIVVARAVTPAEYGAFSTFWSLVIVLGLGVYQPLEQETSRRIAPTHPEPGRPRLLRTVLAVAATLTVVVVALLAAAAPAAQRGGLLDWPLLAAAAVTSVVYAAAFPVRGIVSGRHRAGVYASIIAADGLLRIVIPLVLAAVGAAMPAYAFAVPVVLLLAMAPAIGELLRVRHEALPEARYGAFAGSALRIIVAAFAVQAILSGPVLLTGFAAPEDPALAGRVLAVLTLSRIPVVIYQSLQVMYLPRVARAHAHGGHPGRVVALVAGAAAAVGVVMVLAFWLLGDWIVGVLFGAGIVLGGDVELVLAGGSALFLVALVLSDACVATGRHTALVAVWLPALAVGAAAFLLPIPEPAIRVSVPLLAASAVAAAAFAALLWRSRAAPGSRSAAPAA